MYGKILYNQRGKRDLVKTTAFTSIQSTTTVVPLQRTEGLTENTLLTDSEKSLAEEITSEDRVAEMLTELKTTPDSDDSQKSTSFTKLNIATESSIGQDTNEIDDTKVTDLSTESSSGLTSSIFPASQSFFTVIGSEIDAATKFISEVEEKTVLPSFDEYKRTTIESEESTAEKKFEDMKKSDEPETASIEPTVENIKVSIGGSKISSSDSIFEDTQTTSVKETESQSESGSEFISIQDGGGKIVTDVETQSTEVVSGRDTISSTGKTTEILEAKLATTEVEISAEEIVTVSEALATRTKIPFSEVTERVQVSEVTAFPTVPSDMVSFFMTDKIGQVLSSEIQSTGVENTVGELSTVLPFTTKAIQTEISISDNIIGQHLNPDAGVTVAGSVTPEILSNTESMYTLTQDEQTLEVDSDKINSLKGSKDVGTTAVLNTNATSSSEKESKESKEITFDSASIENVLTTSIPSEYEDESVDTESKVFGKIADEISSDTVQVTTETTVVNSRKSESVFHTVFSTTEDGDVSSISIADETSEISSMPISKEMELELTSATSCVTTEIRTYVESESTTSENEELSESKSLETSDSNSSSDVRDTNSSESSTVESKSEDQVSSVESATTESNSSIELDWSYETSFDITGEEIKSNFTNEHDSRGSVPNSLPLETSTVKSAEVTMSFEIMTRGSNIDTTTVKDELSEIDKIESTAETIDKFISSISSESEETDVTQESETTPTELTTTDQETNETTTESEIDSGPFQFWNSLLTTFEILLKYLTSTTNTYQIASATPIQSGDGSIMEVTESFRSETSNTTLTPIELISLESTLNSAADGIIVSATEQSPNPELDESVSTGSKTGRGYTTVSFESQDSEVRTSGQETSMAITEIGTKVEGGSKPSSKNEITDKTEESIPTQPKLTENASETSNTSEQKINSNEVIMDVTSTLTPIKEVSSTELPTTKFENENKSKNDLQTEIPVIEQVTLEQTFTEDKDSDNNPLENKGTATETEMGKVQSEAPTGTKKHSSREQSSSTRSNDLTPVDTTETINNAEIATSIRANINDVTSKINNLEDFEKPTDKRYTVATTTSFTDKVSEVDNESGFGVFLGTESSLKEETTGEDITSLPSLDNEQTNTEAIFDPAQSLISTTESEINFVTEASEIPNAEIGSSSEVLTSSDNEMVTAELFKETLATNTSIENASSDMNTYTETSWTDSEATERAVEEISTTSQLGITEAKK
ncbi:unnamed protein product, partial [Hymenolepis diminuta]